jgi:small subunit ribosomal protein S20
MYTQTTSKALASFGFGIPTYGPLLKALASPKCQLLKRFGYNLTNYPYIVIFFPLYVYAKQILNTGILMAEKDPKEKKKCPTAKKRMNQNQKRQLRNRSFKSRVRTAIRTFENALSSGEKERMQIALNVVYSLMDKGVKAKTYKKNKAARVKSHLAFLEKKSA